MKHIDINSLSLTRLSTALLATLSGPLLAATGGYAGNYIGARNRNSQEAHVSTLLSSSDGRIHNLLQRDFIHPENLDSNVPDEIISVLRVAWPTVHQALTDWSNNERFEHVLVTAFGNNASQQAQALRAQLLRRDWRILPALVIRPQHELAAAKGAYASKENVIYMSEEFISRAAVDEIASVWLEEIGHAFDKRLNAMDSVGDEGAIFSRLLLGKSISAAELVLLKNENDHARLNIAGEHRVVELATFTVINSNDAGAGSLRQAIIDANVDATKDTIDFNTGLATITLTSGELQVTNPVAITGDTDATASTRNR